MHAAYVLDTVTDNSERICGSTIEIAVLASEVDEENRVSIPVEKLHVHISLRAGSFDIPSACDNRVCALIVLQYPHTKANEKVNLSESRTIWHLVQIYKENSKYSLLKRARIQKLAS